MGHDLHDGSIQNQNPHAAAHHSPTGQGYTDIQHESVRAILDHKFPEDEEGEDTAAHAQTRLLLRTAEGDPEANIEISEEVLQAIGKIGYSACSPHSCRLPAKTFHQLHDHGLLSPILEKGQTCYYPEGSR